jgi:hypothetical protein
VPGPGELSRFPNQMPPRALAISAPMPLCVAVSAPCGLLRPRVAVPCVLSVALSIYMSAARAAVRHGYISLFGPYPPMGCRPMHSPFVLSAGSPPPPICFLPPPACACGAVRSPACFFFSTALFMSAALRPRLSLSLLQPCLWAFYLSQPELGTNTASLRAPNRPLSGSMAFLDHLGLNTVQKSKGKAKNPLNGARQ